MCNILCYMANVIRFVTCVINLPEILFLLLYSISGKTIFVITLIMYVIFLLRYVIRFVLPSCNKLYYVCHKPCYVCNIVYYMCLCVVLCLQIGHIGTMGSFMDHSNCTWS